ncbi:MAG: LysM peptidoglycan-binding domain-containing protein [Chloroflexi bacterium]|nr:LysM peptidoglycan-binding domain-containing protein [Chloroflexota bacterium]
MIQPKMLWLVFFVLALLIVGAPTSAQTNLLTNGSFESESYTLYIAAPDDSARFNVPQSWNGWLIQGNDPNRTWFNVIPNGYPQVAWPRRGNTGRAYNIGRGDATFTAAIYQRVAVAPGTAVQGSAWVYNENNTGTSRIGIDPNGGTNPFDSDILWGNWVAGPNSDFFQTTVNATSTGDAVTVWLYSTQSNPATQNGVYWDDAELIQGGPGGAAPGSTPVSGVAVVPTTPPIASFVQPQAPQPDGSIVHTVQPGDTLSSIAFAYGVTIQEIQTLNNISNPRLISVGQQLLIRPAPDSGSAPAPSGSPAVGSAANPPAATPGAPSIGTPAEPTARPTNTPVPPTSTPAPPAPVRQVTQEGLDPAQTSATLCVQFFEDANQNRLQDADEALLSGGEIALSGQSSASGQTAAAEALCFANLAAGHYVAAASAPAGYGLTTPDQLRVQLFPGETLFVAFGAASGVEVAAVPTADAQTAPVQEANPPLAEETRAPSALDTLLENSGLIVLGLAGMVMLAGLGLTLFGLLRRR